MNLLKVDTIEKVQEKLDFYFKNMDWRKEEVLLTEAVGRYLATAILSEEDLPGFSKSVVDGYAVFAKDTYGVSENAPVFLEIKGEVQMGHSSEKTPVKSGEAVYVPTGGMLPPGADSVIMVEYVEKLDEKMIAVYKPAAPGMGVMAKGEDFKKEQVLYPMGHRITAWDVAMLAASGAAFVTVFAKPKVAVLSTGDELVTILEEPALGQVRDINAHALAAAILETGAEVGLVGLSKDQETQLEELVSRALTKNDVVLISGGSSAGSKDYTAQTIQKMGTPGVITHGITMKPGKPTILGVIKNERCCCHDRANLIAGLPGHPAAAILVYRAIIDPFLKKYFFQNEEKEVSIRAVLSENIPGGEGRETFIFVRLEEGGDGPLATPIHGKSGSISPLRYADGYLRIPAQSEGKEKGALVEIFLTRR